MDDASRVETSDNSDHGHGAPDPLDDKTEQSIVEFNEASKSENVTSQTASDNDTEKSPQKSTCQALSDGHSALKINLQSTLFELLEKEDYHKDLEEEDVRLREKTWMLEERIRLLSEKLCGLQRSLERKEKLQECVLMELADNKWKLQEAKQFLHKLQSSCAQMKEMKKKRKDEFAAVGSQGEDSHDTRRELQQEIMKLANYKLQLQRGEAEVSAILNGTKLMELERQSQSLREAIDERSVRSESLYVDIDEKADRIQRKKESLEKFKKQRMEILRDRKNHFAYLAETELRLQRSLDYLRSKIDYGIYVPAPWPNLRETLKFKI